MRTTATRHEHDTTRTAGLFMAFELREKTWQLGFSIGHGHQPRARMLPARDQQRVLDEIAHAKARCGTAEVFVGNAHRLGGTRAAVAVGHRMLVIVSPQLWQGTSDEEQRSADQRPTQAERDRKRAIKALERLGDHVTVDRVASSLGVHPKPVETRVASMQNVC